MVLREEKKILFGKTGKALQKTVLAKKAEVKGWSATFLRGKLRRLQLDGKGRLELSRIEFELGGGSVPAVYWATGSDELQPLGGFQPPFPSDTRFDHGVSGEKIKRSGTGSALRRLAIRAETRKLLGFPVTTAAQRDALEFLEQLNPRRRKRHARSGTRRSDMKRDKELRDLREREEREQRKKRKLEEKRLKEMKEEMERLEKERIKEEERKAIERAYWARNKFNDWYSTTGTKGPIDKRYESKEPIVDDEVEEEKSRRKRERERNSARLVGLSKGESFGKGKSKAVDFRTVLQEEPESSVMATLNSRLESYKGVTLSQNAGALPNSGSGIVKKTIKSDLQYNPLNFVTPPVLEKRGGVSKPSVSSLLAELEAEPVEEKPLVWKVRSCSACKMGLVATRPDKCRCAKDCNYPDCPKATGV